jgi:uncharacterized repeat protein (TIGR02543 family)
MYNNGSIISCYNTGSVSASGGYPTCAGGIAGSNSQSIESCYNTGSVSVSGGGSYNYAGGIAGSNSQSIESCYNTGSVSALGDLRNDAGGIAGYNRGTIESCYNTGSVSASGGGIYNYAGGIAGMASVQPDPSAGFNPFYIENCYYNNETFLGDGIGEGIVEGVNLGGELLAIIGESDFSDLRSGCTGLTTAQMTEGDWLLNLSGDAFSKRENANGIIYYPELNVFKDSENPTIARASMLSAVDAEAGTSIVAITYNYGGATGGNTLSCDLAVPGFFFTLAEPTRTYYIFVGWFDAESGGGRYTYEDGEMSVYGSVSRITLYARWEAERYYISYDAGVEAGGVVREPYTVESGRTALAPLSREGFEFWGWYDSEDFGGAPIEYLEAGSTGDRTFYAKWTAAASQTEDLGGGTDGAGAADGAPTVAVDASDIDWLLLLLVLNLLFMFIVIVKKTETPASKPARATAATVAAAIIPATVEAAHTAISAAVTAGAVVTPEGRAYGNIASGIPAPVSAAMPEAKRRARAVPAAAIVTKPKVVAAAVETKHTAISAAAVEKVEAAPMVISEATKPEPEVKQRYRARPARATAAIVEIAPATAEAVVTARKARPIVISEAAKPESEVKPTVSAAATARNRDTRGATAKACLSCTLKGQFGDPCALKQLCSLKSGQNVEELFIGFPLKNIKKH